MRIGENIMEIKDFYLSKSSAEKFLQCGESFSKRYIQKVHGLQKAEDMEASLFGNLIHELLEEKYGIAKDRDVIEMFKEKFVKYPILSKRFYDLGVTLLEDYVSSSAPTKKVLGLELPFQFFLDNGVPIKGIIDRVDEISEDECEIIDYKTGLSQALSEYELREDIQIGMYNLAANHLFPQYKKVKLTLNYMHHGPVSVYRDAANLESLKGYLKVIYEKIQKAVETGEGLEPRINNYCGYCEYKGTCSLYKEVLTSQDKDLETFNGMILPETGITVDIDKIDIFHKFIKNKIKILENMEEKVKVFIGDLMKKEGGHRITLGKTNYQFKSKKYTNYKVEDVILLAQEKGFNLNEVLSVQKTALDTKLNDEEINKLKKTANIGYGKQYVA